MANWNNYYNLGIQIEQSFAQKLVSTHGGIIHHSSKHEDINDHIDLIWTINDKQYTFDVKGVKKNNRIDTNYNDSIHWIELQNVNGKKGWLYGKAQYIVFETNINWIIVKRLKLIDFIDSKITDRTITNTKELYTLYRRTGRKDVITKIPTSDLLQIGKILIK